MIAEKLYLVDGMAFAFRAYYAIRTALTDAKGEVTQYEAGESLVVPKGFVGTWEMQGDFRELVVIEKKAYVRAEESE